MSQNIYDDDAFFAGYKRLRDTGAGLNEVLEQPALRGLLPGPAGLRVLELGCGMGQFALWCAEQGAAEVVAVDVSSNMLAVAREERPHPAIRYVQSSIEELESGDTPFDLVVSSLSLHYVEDFPGVAAKVYGLLNERGHFVFSVEHPICTAARAFPGWVKDDQGNRRFWAVDDYGDEGLRVQHWFVDGVRKFHRTVAGYMNPLIEAGFTLERIEEPEATPSALAARPDLADERRRPPFLLIRARR